MTIEFLKAQAVKLDKNGPLPLYYQIKQQLKMAIETSHLRPDEALPSERDLIELYRVSRPTVRQATEELLTEGYLYRRKGLGTFVARPKFKQRLPNILGFTERMLREGKVPASQVISAGVLEMPGGTILGHLGLAPGSAVFQVKRLRLADGEPIMLETTNLPLNQFPKLPQADFSKVSLYQFLREEHSFTIARLRETLEPVVLRDNESKLLGVEKGSPAMLVQISAFGLTGQAVEYSQALVRGDRCQYFLELETGENGNGSGMHVIHHSHVTLTDGIFN
ncbi:MAG TPA: GntR family transcriptional regulator [Chloroflexia bacterium]|nr:GntR family transcriptional regulator [Chloroflexia bacterium]